MERSEGKEVEEDGGRCCMCGDVGFSDQLLRCPACRTRLQHAYCSRMYPNIEMERWQCEWCLHEDHHKQQQQKQQQQQQQQNSSIATSRLKKRHRDEGERAERREIKLSASNSTVTAKKQHLQRHQEKEPSSSVSSLRARVGDRWRKPGCNSSSSRVVGRRYKLLADVLC